MHRRTPRLFAACLLLALIAPPAIAAPPPELPVGDFFRDPEFTSVSMSPQGTHLAVSVPRGDRTELAILRTADLSLIGRFDYGENRHIERIEWVSDRRFIMFVTRKIGRFDFRIGSGDMYIANVDGTRRIDVPRGNTYTLIDTLRGDDRYVLVSRSIDGAFLYRLDTHTGDISTVATAPLDFGGFVVDSQGRPRYAFGQDDDLSQSTYRRVGEGWQRVHSRRMGEGGSRMPLRMHSDDEQVLMMLSDAGEPERISLFDAQGQERQVLARNPNVDPIDGFFSSDDKTLLATRFMDGIPGYQWVDPQHPETRLLAGLVNAFPDRVVDFSSFSEDGRFLLFRVYSDTDPGSYFLFDRENNQARFLLARMDWIQPAQMAEMRPITVTARDGVKLHGYLTVPRGVEARDLPLILHPHGGPHGPRDEWRFNPEVQFLANRGYAVLQINFRGSGGYGDAFEAKGFRRWGTTMIDDMSDAVQWTIDQGIADPERICTYGASYGGFAAMQSVVREPERYRCAISYVGVHSLPLMFSDGDIPESESGRAYLRRVLPEALEEQRAQSPAYNIDRIRVPVMLVHGERDLRVPMSQFRILERRLAEAGRPVEETVLEAREGHGFFDFQNQVDLYTRIEAFLDRHIGNP
ncbi:S9 family peptidase [Silanimonas sp.]|uniref:S9 family peptidase n=1 Tax=Silanimonas sp. TaxID=1929290 RepID=UPI001BC69310|nr:S9 family peptidase [Silanimonas sp.]MBS3896238.1 S9 family peptidase [Silanimonas sp.]